MSEEGKKEDGEKPAEEGPEPPKEEAEAKKEDAEMKEGQWNCIFRNDRRSWHLKNK